MIIVLGFFFRSQWVVWRPEAWTFVQVIMVGSAASRTVFQVSHYDPKP